MGRLSLFSGEVTLGLFIFITIFLTSSHAAPVTDSDVSRYANEKGCYFMNKHYETGHEIVTNDPCMNCTCTGAAMMCYLRVCPFIKPLGNNCHMEKHVDDCCPKYWCPEVYPRLSTKRPETEAKGCYVNGMYFEEGARLPIDPMNPCHACYCIRNVSVCTNETCELHIPGCYPRYKLGSCCPASYACTDEAATTIPPTSLEAEIPPGCDVNGVTYEDGAEVPSNETCKKCYCMRHQVMCTAMECTAPGTNCVPHETMEGQCCPEKYDCPEDTEITEFATTHMISTEEEFLNLTTVMPTTASVSVSTVEEDLSSVSEDQLRTTVELEDMHITTKGVRKMDDEDALTTVPEMEGESSTTGASTATDLISRPREPKITEAPEEALTTYRSTAGRPIFYPSRPIPGEGICRHENRTYQNRQKVVSHDPCRENCTCINSVVKCDVVECILVPPESGSNCKVKKLPEECCPKYVCDPQTSTPSLNETEIPQQQVIVDSFTKETEETMKTTTVLSIERETTEKPVFGEEILTMPDKLTTEPTRKQTDFVSSVSDEKAFTTESIEIEATKMTTEKPSEEAKTTETAGAHKPTQEAETESTLAPEDEFKAVTTATSDTETITSVTEAEKEETTTKSEIGKTVSEKATQEAEAHVSTFETETVTARAVTSETASLEGETLSTEGKVKEETSATTEAEEIITDKMTTETKLLTSHLPTEGTQTEFSATTLESKTVTTSAEAVTTSSTAVEETEASRAAVTDKTTLGAITAEAESLTTRSSTEEKELKTTPHDQSKPFTGPSLGAETVSTVSTDETGEEKRITTKIDKTTLETQTETSVFGADLSTKEKETSESVTLGEESKTVTSAMPVDISTPASTTEKVEMTTETEIVSTLGSTTTKIESAFTLSPSEEKRTISTLEDESEIFKSTTSDIDTSSTSLSEEEIEKAAVTTESEVTTLGVKVTEEIRKTTTIFPIDLAEKETKSTTDDQSKVVTTKIMEAETEKIEDATIAPDDGKTVQTTTEGMEKMTVYLPTDETTIRVATKDESIIITSTSLDSKTVSTSLPTDEKYEGIVVTTEVGVTETKLEQKEQKVTTVAPVKENVTETKFKPGSESGDITTISMEAETATTSPSTADDKLTTVKADSEKTILEVVTTEEMKKATIHFATDETEIIATTAATYKDKISTSDDMDLESLGTTLTKEFDVKEDVSTSTESEITSSEIADTKEVETVTARLSTEELKTTIMEDEEPLKSVSVSTTSSTTEKTGGKITTEEDITLPKTKITADFDQTTPSKPFEEATVQTEEPHELESKSTFETVTSTEQTARFTTSTLAPDVSISTEKPSVTTKLTFEEQTDKMDTEAEISTVTFKDEVQTVAKSDIDKTTDFVNLTTLKTEAAKATTEKLHEISLEEGQKMTTDFKTTMTGKTLSADEDKTTVGFMTTPSVPSEKLTTEIFTLGDIDKIKLTTEISMTEETITSEHEADVTEKKDMVSTETGMISTEEISKKTPDAADLLTEHEILSTGVSEVSTSSVPKEIQTTSSEFVTATTDKKVTVQPETEQDIRKFTQDSDMQSTDKEASSSTTIVVSTSGTPEDMITSTDIADAETKKYQITTSSDVETSKTTDLEVTVPVEKHTIPTDSIRPSTLATTLKVSADEDITTAKTSESDFTESLSLETTKSEMESSLIEKEITKIITETEKMFVTTSESPFEMTSLKETSSRTTEIPKTEITTLKPLSAETTHKITETTDESVKKVSTEKEETEKLFTTLDWSSTAFSTVTSTDIPKLFAEDALKTTEMEADTFEPKTTVKALETTTDFQHETLVDEIEKNTESDVLREITSEAHDLTETSGIFDIKTSLSETKATIGTEKQTEEVSEITEIEKVPTTSKSYATDMLTEKDVTDDQYSQSTQFSPTTVPSMITKEITTPEIGEKESEVTTSLSTDLSKFDSETDVPSLLTKDFKEKTDATVAEEKLKTGVEFTTGMTKEFKEDSTTQTVSKVSTTEKISSTPAMQDAEIVKEQNLTTTTETSFEATLSTEKLDTSSAAAVTDIVTKTPFNITLKPETDVTESFATTISSEIVTTSVQELEITKEEIISSDEIRTSKPDVAEGFDTEGTIKSEAELTTTSIPFEITTTTSVSDKFVTKVADTEKPTTARTEETTIMPVTVGTKDLELTSEAIRLVTTTSAVPEESVKQDDDAETEKFTTTDVLTFKSTKEEKIATEVEDSLTTISESVPKIPSTETSTLKTSFTEVERTVEAETKSSTSTKMDERPPEDVTLEPHEALSKLSTTETLTKTSTESAIMTTETTSDLHVKEEKDASTSEKVDVTGTTLETEIVTDNLFTLKQHMPDSLVKDTTLTSTPVSATSATTSLLEASEFDVKKIPTDEDHLTTQESETTESLITFTTKQTVPPTFKATTTEKEIKLSEADTDMTKATATDLLLDKDRTTVTEKEVSPTVSSTTEVTKLDKTTDRVSFSTTLSSTIKSEETELDEKSPTTSKISIPTTEAAIKDKTESTEHTDTKVPETTEIQKSSTISVQKTDFGETDETSQTEALEDTKFVKTTTPQTVTEETSDAKTTKQSTEELEFKSTAGKDITITTIVHDKTATEASVIETSTFVELDIEKVSKSTALSEQERTTPLAEETVSTVNGTDQEESESTMTTKSLSGTTSREVTESPEKLTSFPQSTKISTLEELHKFDISTKKSQTDAETELFTTTVSGIEFSTLKEKQSTFAEQEIKSAPTTELMEIVTTETAEKDIVSEKDFEVEITTSPEKTSFPISPETTKLDETFVTPKTTFEADSEAIMNVTDVEKTTEKSPIVPTLKVETTDEAKFDSESTLTTIKTSLKTFTEIEEISKTTQPSMMTSREDIKTTTDFVSTSKLFTDDKDSETKAIELVTVSKTDLTSTKISTDVEETTDKTKIIEDTDVTDIITASKKEFTSTQKPETSTAFEDTDKLQTKLTDETPLEGAEDLSTITPKTIKTEETQMTSTSSTFTEKMDDTSVTTVPSTEKIEVTQTKFPRPDIIEKLPTITSEPATSESTLSAEITTSLKENATDEESETKKFDEVVTTSILHEFTKTEESVSFKPTTVTTIDVTTKLQDPKLSSIDVESKISTQSTIEVQTLKSDTSEVPKESTDFTYAGSITTIPQEKINDSVTAHVTTLKFEDSSIASTTEMNSTFEILEKTTLALESEEITSPSTTPDSVTRELDVETISEIVSTKTGTLSSTVAYESSPKEKGAETTEDIKTVIFDEGKESISDKTVATELTLGTTKASTVISEAETEPDGLMKTPVDTDFVSDNATEKVLYSSTPKLGEDEKDFSQTVDTIVTSTEEKKSTTSEFVTDTTIVDKTSERTKLPAQETELTSRSTEKEVTPEIKLSTESLTSLVSLSETTDVSELEKATTVFEVEMPVRDRINETTSATDEDKTAGFDIQTKEVTEKDLFTTVPIHFIPDVTTEKILISTDISGKFTEFIKEGLTKETPKITTEKPGVTAETDITQFSLKTTERHVDEISTEIPLFPEKLTTESKIRETTLADFITSDTESPTEKYTETHQTAHDLLSTHKLDLTTESSLEPEKPREHTTLETVSISFETSSPPSSESTESKLTEADKTEPTLSSISEAESLRTTPKDKDTSTTVSKSDKTDLYTSTERPLSTATKIVEITSPTKEITEETKMPTLAAETTLTEHTIITEETISSNATFAVDAMVKTTTTPQTPKSGTTSETTMVSSDEGVTIQPSSSTLKAETFSEIPTVSSDGLTTQISEKISTTSKFALDAETTISKELSSESVKEFTGPSSTIKPDEESFTTKVLETTTELDKMSPLPDISQSTEISSVDDTTSVKEAAISTFSTRDKASTIDESTEETIGTKLESTVTVEKSTEETGKVESSTAISTTTQRTTAEKTSETLVTTELHLQSTKLLATPEVEASTYPSEVTFPTQHAEEIKTTVSEVTEKQSEPMDTETTLIGKEISIDTDTSTTQEVSMSTDKFTSDTTETSDSRSRSELPDGLYSRRNENTDDITTGKEIESTTKLPPLTSEDIKTSPKLQTEIIISGETTSTAKPASTSVQTKDFMSTDSEIAKLPSTVTEKAPEPSTLTITQKHQETVTERTGSTKITEGVSEESETTKMPEMLSTHTITFKELSETTEAIDVTHRAEEVMTTPADKFTIKETDTELPIGLTEKEKHVTEKSKIWPDIDIATDISTEKITDMGSLTTSRIAYERTETTEAKLHISTTSEITQTESSASEITDISPKATESTASTATTATSEITTEKISSAKPERTTYLEIKDFTPDTKTVSERRTTESSLKEETTPVTTVDEEQEEREGCVINGTLYKEGEAITTIDPCEKCHCSLGEITCFKIICKLPKAGCVPSTNSSYECCPSSYECPEEDETTSSVTITHRQPITEKDLTTPIPISFMFSTVPTSIASTMLVTKSDESAKETEESVESSTQVDLTTAKKDVTVTEIGVFDITEKITSEPSYSATSEKSPPFTEIDKDLESTTAVFDSEITETESELKSETEKIVSEDYDRVSTFSTPKIAIQKAETGTVLTSESTIFTTENITSEIGFISTTSKLEETSAHVIKEPTETPTTFDTTKTTFAGIHEEKVEEATKLPESTSATSFKAEEDATKLSDITTVSEKTSTEIFLEEKTSLSTEDTEKVKSSETTIETLPTTTDLEIVTEGTIETTAMDVKTTGKAITSDEKLISRETTTESIVEVNEKTEEVALDKTTVEAETTTSDLQKTSERASETTVTDVKITKEADTTEERITSHKPTTESLPEFFEETKTVTPLPKTTEEPVSLSSDMDGEKVTGSKFTTAFETEKSTTVTDKFTSITATDGSVSEITKFILPRTTTVEPISSSTDADFDTETEGKSDAGTTDQNATEIAATTEGKISSHKITTELIPEATEKIEKLAEDKTTVEVISSPSVSDLEKATRMMPEATITDATTVEVTTTAERKTTFHQTTESIPESTELTEEVTFAKTTIKATKDTEKTSEITLEAETIDTETTTKMTSEDKVTSVTDATKLMPDITEETVKGAFDRTTAEAISSADVHTEKVTARTSESTTVDLRTPEISTATEEKGTFDKTTTKIIAETTEMVKKIEFEKTTVEAVSLPTIADKTTKGISEAATVDGKTTEESIEITEEGTTSFKTTTKLLSEDGIKSTVETPEAGITKEVALSKQKTAEEDVTVFPSTSIPSKLPKFDDITTSATKDLPTTLTSTKFSQESETVSTDTSLTSIVTEVTEKTLKDLDITVSTEEEPSTIPSIKPESVIRENITTTPVEEKSSSFSEITKETTLSTIPVTLSTLNLTSVEVEKTTVKIASETTESAIPTKVSSTEDDEIHDEILSDAKLLGLGKSTPSITSSSIESTTKTVADEISDSYIITEVLKINATVTSLDRAGTVTIPHETTKLPTDSTFTSPINKTEDVGTTVFKDEILKPETTTSFSEFTDKIFTFVSTRFTDIMKEVTDFTTMKSEAETLATTLKESTTQSTLTTEKFEKMPLVPLTRKIDSDGERITTKRLPSEEFKTTHSHPAEESSSVMPLSTSADKELSETATEIFAGSETTTYKDVPKDVFTTFASDTTSFKQEITHPVSESETAITFTTKLESANGSKLADVPVKTTAELDRASTEKYATTEVFSTLVADVEKFKTELSTDMETTTASSTSTMLPKTSSESVDEKSIIKVTTQESKSESSIMEDLTTPKEHKKTTAEFSTVKLSTDAFVTHEEKESEATTFIAETEPTFAPTTKQETEVASRGTRKDMEFEITPTSFTRTEKDSETLGTTDERELSSVDSTVSSYATTTAFTAPFEKTTLSGITTELLTLSVTEETVTESFAEVNETDSTTHKEKEESIATSSTKIVDEDKTTLTDASSTKKYTEEMTIDQATTLASAVSKTTGPDTISVEDEMKKTTTFEKTTVTTDVTGETTVSFDSEEIINTTQTEKSKPTVLESTLYPKITTRIDQNVTTLPSVEMSETKAESEKTTLVQQAETTAPSFAEKSTQADSVDKLSPEFSTPVSTEDLNVTEYVTKGYKAIETTTMKEEEDYLIDENTCIFEGRIYQSAEQIPRADPCEFCFCFRGDIICLQQSCPPPAANCHQTMIPGYCCPRYECPVYVTSKNMTGLSRRKGVSPIIIQKRIDKREIRRPIVEVKGCQINGTFYEMGKTVTSASGPCLHCVCQEDGFMHCDPQRCKPQAPLMLKINNSFFRR